MTDLDDLRVALHERPGRPLPELDLAQIMVAGARIRRRRRVRRGGAVLAGAVLSTLVVIGLGPALPGATDRTARLDSISLVSYAGTQPQGYQVSWVPQNWVIQGGDQGVLTIAPAQAQDQDPNHFVDKLVVLSASRHEARTGTPQPVDGRPGTLSTEGDVQSLTYKSDTGRWVVIQAPVSLGWNGSQIAKFASGVKVLPDVRDGLG